MSTTKQEVLFMNGVTFHEIEYYDKEGINLLKGTIADVYTVNHPKLGMDRVRTSLVQKKFDDGSFETINTIYRPLEKNNEYR